MFSQSLYSLDLIEHFLGKVDEATQEARIDEKLAGHVGKFTSLHTNTATSHTVEDKSLKNSYLVGRQVEPKITNKLLT